MRKRLSAILSGAAVPGWIVFIWVLADVVSRMETIGRAMHWLTTLVSAAPGWILAASVLWLTLVVVWPDLKASLGIGKAPGLSNADARLLARATEELGKLTTAQRFALGSIYRNPGHFLGQVQRQLSSEGFAEPKDAMDQLLATVLISMDGRMNLNPSQHPVVAQTVERFLAASR
jgi:hypothetical protein